MAGGITETGDPYSPYASTSLYLSCGGKFGSGSRELWTHSLASGSWGLFLKSCISKFFWSCIHKTNHQFSMRALVTCPGQSTENCVSTLYTVQNMNLSPPIVCNRSLKCTHTWNVDVAAKSSLLFFVIKQWKKPRAQFVNIWWGPFLYPNGFTKQLLKSQSFYCAVVVPLLPCSLAIKWS